MFLSSVSEHRLRVRVGSTALRCLLFLSFLKHISALLSRFIFPKVLRREVARGGARRAAGEQEEVSREHPAAPAGLQPPALRQDGAPQ